jgi:hypothetical protein
MPNQRLLIPVYATTLLLSAFLLFAVQPLLGKMILPLLGGAPAVWNAAMVFFQAMLLAGYAYAHFTSGMKPSRQAVVHIVLLLICAAALPVAIPEAWKNPPATGNPVLWQMGLMAVTAGGPFFALAASAPLLQRWFSFTGHRDAANPYFLYAASNVGSMAALLLYPFAIEPHLALGQQAKVWGMGYGLLIALIGGCALLAAKVKSPQASPATPEEAAAPRSSLKQVGLWLLLSFLPSSLMLGVTTYITTDIAAVPLLWTIPLALYTGSFIVAFARKWPVSLGAVTWLQGVALAATLGLVVHSFATYKLALFVLHLLLLFLSALLCHMQLAREKPHARHLTLFYLVIAAGGVAGGLFNTLAAPYIFPFPLEYPIVLAAVTLVRFRGGITGFSVLRRGPPAPEDKKSFLSLITQSSGLTAMAVVCITALFFQHDTSREFFGLAALVSLSTLALWRWPYAAAALTLLVIFPQYQWSTYKESLSWQRNFFGILRVEDIEAGRTDRDGVLKERALFFDTTLHGAQALTARYQKVPLTYYSPAGPAGDIFEALNKRPGKQNVAALGLGLGSIACYALPRRHFDFYEINPAVVKMAEDPKLFTFLSGCKADYKIVMGDARLNLAKAPDHSYDLIFVDTFSSDNIPVHMMTKEAFELYFRKLRPGGLIAINISNRYLYLGKIVSAIARDLKVYAMRGRTDTQVTGDNLFISAAEYIVLSEKGDTLWPFFVHKWDMPLTPPSWKAWRDDYSDIVSALIVLDKYKKVQ